MKEMKEELKMNLQLFAEGEPEDKGANPEGGEPENKPEPSLEELLAERDKENQAETDRRVNQALEKLKKEYEEKERLAKLTEEERISEIEKQKEEALAIREKELEVKTAQLDILEKLKEEDLLEASSILKPENYLGDNKGNLEKDIEDLKKFLELKTGKVTEGLKKEILGSGEIPGKGNTSTTEYEIAKKSGNLLDMLSAKLK